MAEEAARLIEMLSATGRPWAGSADFGPGNDDATDTVTDEATTDATGSRASEGGDSGPGHGQSRACTCGGTTPAACRLCPVCQLIALVGALSPETIDRAADIVDLAATALRDLATTQRLRRPAPEATAPEGP